MWRLLSILFLVILTGCRSSDLSQVDRFAVFEAQFVASGQYDNPYVEMEASATVTAPDGRIWQTPLFWDGADIWRLRFSPDVEGTWKYELNSPDSGLDGMRDEFLCTVSELRGSIQPMEGHPNHFEYQDGTPVWFMGDTAWGYLTDSDEDNHHRQQAGHYASARASQGFNVIHSMMLSEQGVGNNNGMPFEDLGSEKINPAYWREVDERIAFANQQGLVVGLAVAWGDKRKVEPFAWRRFASIEARKRYARYVAARYSAYSIYWLVSGEWHAEARTRDDVSEETVMNEFIEIGDTLAEADPHDRMMGIHPMTQKGSVREYYRADWMSFGDYQQNYRDLHMRVMLSRRLIGPVVNSEYGYYLRDSDGDGKPDKSNSFSADDMRHASWDIVTAGGYLVTGFGTTYFGGHRDPGPFDVDTPKNDDWEAQIGHIRRFFATLDWWKLVTADELISSQRKRDGDRVAKIQRAGRTITAIRPPEATYWAMSVPGEQYVIYVRGLNAPVTLALDSRAGEFRARQYNPRTGEFSSLGTVEISNRYDYSPPDRQDWVVLLERQ